MEKSLMCAHEKKHAVRVGDCKNMDGPPTTWGALRLAKGGCQLLWFDFWRFLSWTPPASLFFFSHFLKNVVVSVVLEEIRGLPVSSVVIRTAVFHNEWAGVHVPYFPCILHVPILLNEFRNKCDLQYSTVQLMYCFSFCFCHATSNKD